MDIIFFYTIIFSVSHSAVHRRPSMLHNFTYVNSNRVIGNRNNIIIGIYHYLITGPRETGTVHLHFNALLIYLYLLAAANGDYIDDDDLLSPWRRRRRRRFTLLYMLGYNILLQMRTNLL